MAQVGLQRTLQALYEAGFAANLTLEPSLDDEQGNGITVTVHDGSEDHLEKVTFMRVLSGGRRSWPPEGEIARWMLEAALRIGIGRPDEAVQQLIEEACR